MCRGRIHGGTSISGSFNVENWMEFRKKLIHDDSTENDWNTAFGLLWERITTRFLNPIDWIIEKRINKGEGFSVVALQCILIEFLEAFYQGKIYTTSRNPQPFEYNSSKKLFSDFLLGHKPFSEYFKERKNANGFFDNIRCGLIHEAATKETSRINTANNAPSQDAIVSFEADDPTNMRIYRENFSKAILKYIDSYKQELLVNKEAQRSFIRKWDDISGIRHAYYFAYGSNMCRARLIKRIGKYHIAYLAALRDYKFHYNKKSVDGSAKANIEQEAENVVFGICYEIDYDDLKILDDCERGYDRKDIDIELFDSNNNKTHDAKAVVYISRSIDSLLRPTETYKSIVITGARHWKLDESYIRDYLDA
jgi:hypothetical protein